MRKLPIILLAIMACATARAQVFSGEYKYDGQHKNEVYGYLQGGYNIVTDYFFGPTLFYKRHITDRVSLEAGFDIPFGKSKYGLSAQAFYRLPVSYFNFYFSGRFLYNRYVEFRTNEYYWNIAARWEAPYFDITIGGTSITYSLLGSSYTEPLTFMFGAGVNIRPRWNSWNIGLFFRNYDDFYYENWNINWGFRWNANLPLRMKLFGEFNVRPAGSMSQLASKYETSMKVGIKYTW